MFLSLRPSKGNECFTVSVSSALLGCIKLFAFPRCVPSASPPSSARLSSIPFLSPFLRSIQGSASVARVVIYIYSSSNTIQRTLQTLHIPLTPYAQAYLNIFNGFLLQLFRAPHTASSSYVGPACPSHAKFPSTGYALKLRLIRPSCVLHPSIILTSQLELTSIIQVFMSTIQSPELASHTQSLRHVVHVLTHTITHAIRLLCFQLLCTLLPFIVASTTLTKIPPRPLIPRGRRRSGRRSAPHCPSYPQPPRHCAVADLPS